MAFKKYITVKGKRYGPYIYENKRDGNRIITSYLGNVNKEEMLKKNKLGNILLFAILGVALFVLLFSQIGLRKGLTGYAIGEINVSRCIELNKEDYTYRLIEDVSSNTTCFVISANKVTLVGNGHSCAISSESGAAIEIRGVNGTIVEGLSIYDTNCSGKEKNGVVANHSINFTIKNSSVYSCSDFSSGILFFSASDVLMKGMNITTNNDYAYGIKVISGDNSITARDVIFDTGRGNDAYFGENTSGKTSFYNVSFETKKLFFEKSSSINFKKYLYFDLNVKYLNNTFVKGARVVLRNISDSNVFSELTNSSGAIKRKSILVYQQKDNKIISNPKYNVAVKKAGFVSSDKSVNTDGNKNIVFVLAEIGSAQERDKDNKNNVTTTEESYDDKNFSVEDDSQIDSCVSIWECEGWSDCINDKKTRRCEIINDCDDKSDKPLEEIDCYLQNAFFLDYYPTNRLNVAQGESVNFVMNVFMKKWFNDSVIDVKWYLNGDLMKEDKSRGYINSVFIHSFDYNINENVVEAEVSVEEQKQFVFWDISVFNITCEESWHCDWKECDEENMTYAYNCVDLNDCETNLKKPVKERCFCVTKWSCEDWGECETFYSADYIFDTGKVTGEYAKKKERNCVDLNNCEDKRNEYMTCGEKKSIVLKEAEWCGDSYTRIVDSDTNSLIGRMKTTMKNDVTRVDIGILFDGEEGYCSNCFNNFRDANEEDIDCGGECRPCKETSNYVVDISQITWIILFVITFLLSATGIYVGMKVYSLVIALKRHRLKRNKN